MKRTVVALMEDHPGVLNRVVSVMRRRGFNIESLTVGHTDTAGISRMTITVDGNGLTSSTLTQGYLWDGSKWRFVGTGLQDAFGTRLVVSPTAPGTAFVQPDGNIYLLLQQAQRATTQFSGSPVGVDRLKMTVDFK